ncbi:aminoglycoside phosphotransferase family protein [Streptomyces sp. NBC_01433]|uniref:aminoglycoside phosphotransferase family protein n=1 Tax=Streptomyces sp. NBC_01433 TaxID=2903864 RepID=UPI002250AAEE|nr:aminoglycoside phosphotransferase family protein [Streptomyces sp. NBC_01433]MCX4676490.1 aminoglycoside phosphotransferase family protein [Streptomyces sp. NBC_01433]
MVTDVPLVRRLIATQFPRWADLPVERVASHGTVNAIYRLGTDKAVRLPLQESGANDAETECRWLPYLAPRLPFAVPAPLAQGAPAEGHPWSWSVCRWLDGENPGRDNPVDPVPFATDLAEFVTAIRRVDPADGPPAYRSETLASRDTATRAAIAALRGHLDTAATTTAWDEALLAPAASGPAVWVHGDLQPGNVLLADGRLGAVIDFGCMGLADPAVDLIAAWYLLPAGAREAFRTAVAADDAAWARGRGWALSIALMELSYYRETNLVMATTARRVIGELLGAG